MTLKEFRESYHNATGKASDLARSTNYSLIAIVWVLCGQDLAKGAVWKIEYTEGKGFSILNVGTGKYLKDPNSPAKYDEPTYFTLCTLKEKSATGIQEVRGRKSVAKTGAYTLDGRKVNAENLRPGLYIINGKKVVIK